MGYDTDYMYMDGASAEELIAAVRAGHLGGRDYDQANIVSMACEHGALFLDHVLQGIENLGANVDAFAWETDRDHLTAMGLYASHHADIAIVMAKHGVDTSPFWKGGGDLTATDISTLRAIASTTKRAKALLPPTPDYMDPPYVTLPRLADAIGGATMRRDGAARICEHAGAVVKLLEKWGVDKDDSALAWLIGLMDVAEEECEADVIREEVRHATRDHGGRGLVVIDDLTWNSPAKRGPTTSLENFLAWVAGKHTDELFRAIAIADSICLVREWLGGDEKRRQFATWRHLAAGPLFENLDKVVEKKYPGLFKERIPAEIAALQEERESWGDTLFSRRRGGLPVETAPIPAPPFTPKSPSPPSLPAKPGKSVDERPKALKPETPAKQSLAKSIEEMVAREEKKKPEEGSNNTVVPISDKEANERGEKAFRAFLESIWEKTPAGWKLKNRDA